jgi:DNA-damage-inducible protein D
LKQDKIIVFENKRIRRIWHEDDWYFSVIDVVGVLTDSVKPNVYWSVMKERVKSEDGFEVFTICKQLKLESTDGKKYMTDCANTEGMFRIIQSIPSPKAEPFKQWLTKDGYERVQEIENLELAQIRMKQLYEQKRIFQRLD